MKSYSIIYTEHARDQMQERAITSKCVEYILATGEVLEDYPDDTPYPSQLLMGWYNEQCIHVVAATYQEEQRSIIITTYEPNLQKWEADKKTRRKHL